MLRVVLVEQMEAGHGIDIEDDAHQQDHVAHAGDRAHQRSDDEAQLRHGRYEAQDAQYAYQPRHQRELFGGGNERQHHDAEVEEVPAVAEVESEARSDRGDLEQGLQDEHAEDDVVAEVQQVVVACGDFPGSLQADQQAVEEDEPDHEGLEPAGFDDASCERFHGRFRLRSRRNAAADERG